MRILGLVRTGMLSMNLDEINALPTKVVDRMSTIVDLENQVQAAIAQVRSKSAAAITKRPRRIKDR